MKLLRNDMFARLASCIAAGLVFAPAGGAAEEHVTPYETVVGEVAERGPVQQEVFTADFQFVPLLGVVSVNIPRFNTQGGMRVLQQVKLEIDAEVGGVVTAENNSPNPVDWGLAIDGSLISSFGALNNVASFTEGFAAGVVEPTDGVAGSGDDFWDLGYAPAFVARMVTTVDNLQQFVGAEPLNATVSGTASYSLSPFVPWTWTISDFLAAGTLRVTYQYAFATGACCFADLTCMEMTSGDCDSAAGQYQGTLVGCEVVSCPMPCPADCAPAGGNGLVNIDDLLTVVQAFASQDTACDVSPDNGDGTFGNGKINLDDLLAVVKAFGGCP